jgi:peptidoglycan hydrolase CwlO-like protein
MQIRTSAAALKKMSQTTEEVILQLEKNNKEVETEIASLGNQWKDANFSSVKQVIQEKQSNLNDLLKDLKKFREWLERQHKIVKEYEDNHDEIKRI